MNKDIITKTLNELHDRLGDKIFTEPSKFKGALLDIRGEDSAKTIRHLLNVAICDMDAYARLKNNKSLQNALISEMNQVYAIEQNIAQTIISSIGELLGVSIVIPVIQGVSSTKAPANISNDAVITSIHAGTAGTVGLKSDGTIIATGCYRLEEYGGYNVANWKGMVDVLYSGECIVGLKSDKTVITANSPHDNNEMYNTIGWQNIIAISMGTSHLLGLTNNGYVVAIHGRRHGIIDHGECNVMNWNNIKKISASFMDYTVGLKSNGTVVAVGDNSFGQCNVADWRDIIAISAGALHTVGLKANGTVIAVGSNGIGECNVADWRDIVAISAGIDFTVGLKTDGTVIAVGRNLEGQCNVVGWRDIVAISAGLSHTVGLKADGTVVAVGDNRSGECNVADW